MKTNSFLSTLCCLATSSKSFSSSRKTILFSNTNLLYVSNKNSELSIVDKKPIIYASISLLLIFCKSLISSSDTIWLVILLEVKWSNIKALILSRLSIKKLCFNLLLSATSSFISLFNKSYLNSWNI